MSKLKPEQQLHKDVADYLAVALPIDCVFTSINPVSSKKPAAAGLSKALGMKSGIPDLLFIYKARPHFIELKAKRGKISDDQHSMIAMLISAGAVCAIAKSVEDVIAILQAWNIPLRARISA